VKRCLLIQTAALGDVVLLTSILEKLHRFHPEAALDLLVRKGCEGLFDGHPFVHQLYVWDKRKHKTRALFGLLREIRQTRYDHVINAQRYLSTGLLTVFSNAAEKVGYDRNPLSRLFTRRVWHVIPDPRALRRRERMVSAARRADRPERARAGPGEPHEVDRLNGLIEHLTDGTRPMPRLYPTDRDRAVAARLRTQHAGRAGGYVCLAPGSAWPTKAWPAEKWVGLARLVPADQHIFLIGGPEDTGLCGRVSEAAGRGTVLAGTLSLLSTAELMAGAAMNYVNDSVALHLASAMQAPVSAVFCSTVPAFGFGPLHENGRIRQTAEALSCRPCGLHGRRTCPRGDFRCAVSIAVEEVWSFRTDPVPPSARTET